MSVGGIQTYLLNVLRRYDRKRFRMDVCYTGPAPGCLATDVWALGSRLIPCRYSNAVVPFVSRLTRLLQANGYRAVCDFSGDFAAGSMLAGRLAGLPVRIAFYRSSGIQYRPTAARYLVAGLLHRMVSRHATQILSNSRSNLQAAFDRRSAAEPRFEVIYNGVDLDRFAPAGDGVRRSVRAELGIPPEAPLIGHVGSFTPPKAQEVLLAAFARLSRDRAGAWLLFVGDGPLQPQAGELARVLGVAGRVTFAGTRRDVPRLLEAMDLFVLPSRFEGFPNALIEAQAMGVPVVATDRPEIREAVPPENHDCLTPVDDVASLETRIRRLLDHPARSAQKGAAGAAFVRAHLELSRSVEAFCRRLSDLGYGQDPVGACQR